MSRVCTILFCLLTTSVFAQTATDFTIDDVDGNSRNLFTELNAGNVVVLKFFTNWCSICNNTADEVVAIYNNYQSASEPVVFWALNRDANETNADAITYRDNHSIPFPVIGEASSIAQQFGVQYQPEYYIIKPDRSYVQRTNFSSMQTAVDDALSDLSTGILESVETSRLLVLENALEWTAPPNATADLRVVDAAGKLVLDQRVVGQERIVLDFPTGVYIYQLNVDNGPLLNGKVGIAH